MGETYFPQETNTIFLQVLRISGSVPNFPADYTNPQVRVVHQSGGIVEDVALINMTQLDDNLWFFDFAIVSTPFFGTYLSEFKTTIDGIAIEGSDTFKVQPPPDILEQGQGSCQIDAVVQDQGTMQPLAGVTVFAFLPSDLINAIAKDVTDSNGNYTLFLNPGNFKLRFVKTGFIDETHDLLVNANCTHEITGD